MSRARILKSPRARVLALPVSAFALLILVAVFGPVLVGIDPTAMDISGRLAGPSWTHPLGQDEFGRDILSRLLYGARVSLTVAFTATLLAAAGGIAAGLIGGYFRGIAEFLTLRVADVVLAFPPILLALLVVTVAGPGAATLTVVLAVLYMPKFARVTYGEVLSVKNLEYVEAMRALGAGNGRILLGTVLPNLFAPLLVQFSLTIAAAIIVESGLSFLGLGVTPPAPSWGLMIRSARNYMDLDPTGLVWPCLCLVATIFIVNSLCDTLRDAFDPRVRQAGFGKMRAPKTPVPADRAPALSSGEQLRIDNLRVEFATPAGTISAVKDVSLSIRRGETLAVVGESGSGKSVTSLSVMGLLPAEIARVAQGSILFADKSGIGRDLTRAGPQTLQAMRGEDMAVIFQEPMTSLNPVYRIGDQIAEAVLAHRKMSKSEARAIALDMLRRVGMSDPERRLDQYPHELSGGMRQRAVIALALSCNPALLIADEPTTALDVTIQAEVLALIKSFQREREGGMSVLFVTHNLGIVAQIADRVAVMYAGCVVETARTEALFAAPRHPYTKSLLCCIPRVDRLDEQDGCKPRLEAIPGTVPGPFDSTRGCAFAPRCSHAHEDCREIVPALMEAGPDGHLSRCLHWRDL
ncbi:dipeptide/oligopeptide/nickel ABC transporter permease/ATP-binding protein [Chelatococcus sp. GCM10030263]|uniref:dipeptide/oligopeptide/nickel ABC transporter permease/ATP-binding protein n=1 Tax=Chelatococcus sp. GCM10030263 TaxID=3273387 RepID=UPI003613BB78